MADETWAETGNIPKALHYCVGCGIRTKEKWFHNKACKTAYYQRLVEQNRQEFSDFP